MKVSRLLRLWVLVSLCLAACGHVPTGTAGHAQATPTLDPVQYLNEALDLMQNNSLHRRTIDWPSFRADVLRQAANAKTPAETYPYIKIALSHLNDHHSFFISPQDASALNQGTYTTPVPPYVTLVENRFGYVSLPSYAGLNEAAMNQYGTDLQKQILALDRQQPCGWVVDLRGNGGGNMWPMLVGIGPILGNGKAGAFVDADGNATDWTYQDGKALLGKDVESEVNGEPYSLARQEAPVAVLFGPNTTSSGEIIALSFVGRPNTRSFGSPSFGDTTGNWTYWLSDQAILELTTSVDADRTGKTYGEALLPDVSVPGDNSDAGAVPIEAQQWLQSQPACR